MKKVTLELFLKNYFGLVMIMSLIYLILSPSENTSLPLVMILGLPITAIMLFTGLDEKLKKFLP
ncbi:hypothetical protein CWR48_10020 [Oceanobacillus arenosus]|uniref:Uncharacterized protein n=1 Tax=Oceanobacillus arenosus TaxID=1229153 RepID=A0A3D8PRC0_9BACI|nr:hypothetical protein [Oceanobacillus arenosus]RDW18653.1 hypothetical protein CWR48_10020 [Oceanobacillus arenosus]